MKNRIRRNPVRRLLSLASTLVLLLFLAGIGAGTYLFFEAVGRKNAVSVEEIQAETAWMEEGYEMERFSLTVGDGTTLSGYFLPAKKPSRRLAVLVHGRNSHAGRMKKYAEIYLNDNFHVFLADNRGHGKSGGDYIGMGWLERKDYLEWLDVLIPRIESGKEPCEIVLHGLSLGGAAVMMMSGEESLPAQVRCIIADCGFTSVAEEFRHQLTERLHLPAFPMVEIGSLESKLFAGYSFFEASALEQVKKSRVPLFLIHGSADTFVPPSMAHTLYDTAGGEKELWIVEGAGHVKAYSTAPEAYVFRVREFYRRYFSPS